MFEWTLLAAALVAGLGAPVVIDDLTTGKADISRWLRALRVPDGAGDRHVQESLIVLSPGGRIARVVLGQERSVALSVDVDLMLLTPGAALTLVHNHPSGNGFSQNDLQQLEKPGVAAVVAVGHDKSIYVARRGSRFPESGLVGFEGSAYETALKAAQRVLAETVDARLREAYALHLHHVVALGLARAEVLEYRAKLAGEREWTFGNGRVFLAQVRDAVASAVRR